MQQLYPAITASASELLDVGGGHHVYVEHCGAEDGIPVIFLHGGPGSGCKADHRQFFDPKRYRIFLFDQRGCGRSTPYGGVDNNTTELLIEDIEQIRSKYGVDKWLLFGGSWGATLALAYAQACPHRVSGMVLRGRCCARHQDGRWCLGPVATR